MPNASALLDISSNNKGLLIPRMTQAERDLVPPVEGLMVYNTNSNSFQYFTGGSWKNIAHSGIINGSNNKIPKFSGTIGLSPGLMTDNGAGIAINTNNANPHTSALLDITSTGKGVLVPRMTSAERTAITSPAKGLLLFDNTTNTFWFHNGTSWTELGGGNSGNSWNLTGNNISNSNSGNVGIGTTTPLAKLHVADSAVLFTATGIGGLNLPLPHSSPPVEGTGIRMMWYPGKAAFRSGGAFNQWDKDSIGVFSTAFGISSKAIGITSFSTGYNTTARGDRSTSMGSSTEAIGFASTSFGFETIASGYGSTSMGVLTNAIGQFSTSTGFGTNAIGLFSSSFGYATSAKTYGGSVIGSYNDVTDNPNPSIANQLDRLFQIGNGTSGENRRNALTVLRNGNMGLGVLNPDFILDVNGRMRLRSGNNLSAGINLNNNANTAMAAFIGMRSTDNEVGFYGYTGTAGWRFLVNTTTGNAWMQGALTQNSDVRLKKNITPLSHTLGAIQQIKGYTYQWKDPTSPDEQIGLLAQELQKVYPQLVKENANGDLSVNYNGMIPVLLEAIKELQQKVAELEKKIK
ncbi:MAG TPA: tail fiber domain-containing protein [Ferruginibacter sp.]|nr:tail fiber domain-containing protein [Ferruginibacter sp.]